jgi:hypothetical protein
MPTSHTKFYTNQTKRTESRGKILFKTYVNWGFRCSRFHNHWCECRHVAVICSNFLSYCSRNLEITSRNLKITSRNLEITSRNLKITSRNFLQPKRKTPPLLMSIFTKIAFSAQFLEVIPTKGFGR